VDFPALKAELAARGFDYLSDARLGQFVNAGRQKVDNHALWPYRKTTATGTAPLAVSDLGVIEAVVDVPLSYPLQPASLQGLLADYGDLTLTGAPAYFYVASPSGVPTVVVYPTSTHAILVNYWRRCPDLASSATPLSPPDYHMIIVDVAAQYAYMDSDNFTEAQQLQGWVDQRLQDMTDDLLGGQQIWGPQDVQPLTGSSVDG
jgi:hypothetical protein